MKIIPYEEKYREDVHQVCIDTGSEDNLVNPEHRTFTLAMYCDPYLDHGLAYILRADGHARGYILCAPSYDAFEKDMRPYLEKIRKECPHFVHRADISTYGKYRDPFPAHLHIDIEPCYEGKGSGSALMRAMLEHLRKQKIRGAMVIVDKSNDRAVGFYHKNGFETIEKDSGGLVMGIHLL